MSNIKNFVLTCGEKIIDFLTICGIIVAILTFLICLIVTFNYPAPATILLMFVLPISILIFTIISNYFIYLLIDIKKSLNDINSKLK